MAVQRQIDTRNLLYHFLQRDLYDQDPEMFRVLTARLVPRLGIWLSREAYWRLPLVVPYARRDPHSRGNPAAGVGDQWGSPDEHGYFRDDNSLVKGIPRSLPIASSFPQYRARRLASGFVAAHVWRTINAPVLAARNPLTYSFVPNLVWLPAQVAGLSDREGSFVQLLLQRLSLKIYRDAPVARGHERLIKEIWDLLPEPAGESELALPELDTLSFFEPGEGFFLRRAATIHRVAQALLSGAPRGKVVSTRYTAGISEVAPEARQVLGAFLAAYADTARDS